MRGLSRPVKLLKDKRVTLPTDFQGRLYTEINFYNPEKAVATAIRRWIDEVNEMQFA
jgi:hypothetical protein